MSNDHPNTQYRMTVDWPDLSPVTEVKGSAQALTSQLALLPAWLALHPPFSAPIMIEIHDDQTHKTTKAEDTNDEV